MADLSKLSAAVDAQADAVAAVVKHVDDLKTAPAEDPTVQAQVDAMTAKVEANNTALNQAAAK